MSTSSLSGRAGARYSILAGVLLCASGLAAQPTHDSFRGRMSITTLPFTHTVTNVAAATGEPDDPLFPCRLPGEGAGSHTLWYSLRTAADPLYVNISTAGSTYDTLLAVWTGRRGTLVPAGGGCNDHGFAADSRSLLAGLRLEPDMEYILEAASVEPLAAAAVLQLDVRAAPLYVVTRTDDVWDGVCDADCSLREALTASNTAPGAVLLGPAGYKLERPGLEDDNLAGDLDVRAGVGLYGAGPDATVIDAGALDRVLHVVASAPGGGRTVHLHGLHLTNGDSTGYGGGLWLAGAGDFLALEDVAVSDSYSAGSGGGLYLAGPTRLQRLSVSGNRAQFGGGGLFFGDRQGELRDSTVSGNTALGGPGGGGILAGRVRLEQVTLSGNSIDGLGGGLCLGSPVASSARGSTLAFNYASLGGGGLYQRNGSFDLATTVLAGNHFGAQVPSDCWRSTSSGVVFQTSYNLVATPGNCGFTGPGDATSSEPILDPSLRDNGGPTLTHVLVAGSRAIDAGPTMGCNDFQGRLFTADQRGAPRAVDGGSGTPRCDKGAVEYGAVAPD